MTDATARLALPLLQAGQAQKEIYHNEALSRLDLTVAAVVQSIGDDSPPLAPEAGQCWVVGTSPTGAWAGQAGVLAGWTAAGWRFIAMPEGAAVWSIADGLCARRAAGDWSIGDIPATSVRVGGVQVVGSRQAAIADPSGGITVDVEARSALHAICVALRAHGLIAS